jgi:hypothetical protein
MWDVWFEAKHDAQYYRSYFTADPSREDDDSDDATNEEV